MVSHIYLVLLIYIVFNFVQTENDFEFHSASEHLKILLDTQDILIRNIHKYLVGERKRHYVLNKYLKRYRHDYKSTMKNPGKYFGNPINVFTFLKRLTSDVISFEKKIVELTPYTILSNMTLNLPSYIDVKGVTKGLLRLQSTYQLNVTDLADGVVKWRNKDGDWISESVSPMSVADLYDLANVLFDLKDYETALPWVLEAHRRFKPEDQDFYPFTFQKIVEFVAFCYESIGDLETEVSWLQLLVNLDPDDDKAVELLDSRKQKLDFEKTQTIEDKTKKPQESKELGEAKREKEIYQSLCRGEGGLANHITKKLKCRYISESNAYFTIGPMKVEQLHIFPRIYRFLDVISDEDIEGLKDIFKERLIRENVNIKYEPESKATEYRVSKSIWIDNSLEISTKITRLISDTTGLDAKGSEPLKVTNYGYAGYEVHHNSLKMCQRNLLETKENKMSTFLIYLSDVELGGATVFLKAGLTVYPKKGDAIFFENTKNSVDHSISLHAECPVLKGEKWVATKWISDAGNEFQRPCYVSKLKESTRNLDH